MKAYYFKKQYSDGTADFFIERSDGKKILKATIENGAIIAFNTEHPVTFLEKNIMFDYRDETYYIAIDDFTKETLSIELNKHEQ